MMSTNSASNIVTLAQPSQLNCGHVADPTSCTMFQSQTGQSALTSRIFATSKSGLARAGSMAGPAPGRMKSESYWTVLGTGVQTPKGTLTQQSAVSRFSHLDSE